MSPLTAATGRTLIAKPIGPDDSDQILLELTRRQRNWFAAARFPTLRTARWPTVQVTRPSGIERWRRPE